MKKYSKGKLKLKRGIKPLIILFVALFVVSIIILLISIFSKNVVVEKIDTSPSDVSSDIAINSTPIVINNIIVGGVYENKWVAFEKYYLNSKNGEDTEVDVYSKSGKMGKYKIGKIVKDSKVTTASTTVSKSNLTNEYFATISRDNNIMTSPAKKIINIGESYIKDVKKALGLYLMFNSSVKITEAYDVTLSDDNKGYIIFATNEINKKRGVYSAVVYVDLSSKAKVIKYSFISDKKNAEEWPIYSLGFVADLNNDGKNEIIIQETKEFDVKYDVIEFKNNNFYEVLSGEVKK